jgi:hypothetical protein
MSTNSLKTSYVSGDVPGISTNPNCAKNASGNFHKITNLILKQVNYYPSFPDEETEAQRS